MGDVKLLDSFHSPLSDVSACASITDAMELARLLVRDQVSRIGAKGDHCYTQAGHHYFCSTMMDAVFSSGLIQADPVCSLSGGVAQSFTNAYECACWGFCLRYHLAYKRHQKYFAITIVDVNVMDQSYWSSNSQWGASGFGVTTLFFEVCSPVESAEQNGVPGSRFENILIGSTNGDNNIVAFTSFAKKALEQLNSTSLALPFFPEQMSVPVRRAIRSANILSEYHSVYGHAFGSDPWISFIEDHSTGKFHSGDLVLASLALRGYYCFARIHIDTNVNIGLLNTNKLRDRV